MRGQTHKWAIGAGALVGAALWVHHSRAGGTYRPGDGALWAAITGASSGIGEAFARRLAADRYHLLLIARRREQLERLADDLSRRHGVQVEVLPANLAHDTDIARVAQRLGELDRLTLLVNNAGFGTVGTFTAVSEHSQTDMIRLHTEAPARLTHSALPGMIARKQGAIINVSSTAAFFALPGNATYCATKRFLVTFSETLSIELAGRGVTVQALCPGFTRTGFHASENFRTGGKHLPQTPAFLWMTSEAVVSCSLRALGRGVVCIPGAINQLIAKTPALIPPEVIGRAMRAFGL